MTTVPAFPGTLLSVEPLESIAAADAHLGRTVPLPSLALPLARWVEVTAQGPGAVEVEWNLDDSRGGPGRLALFVSTGPAPTQLPDAGPRPSASTPCARRRWTRPRSRCGRSPS